MTKDQSNSEGPWDGTTWGTAFATVQRGVDATQAGDTVIVATGLYQQSVVIPERSIALTSTNPEDRSVAEATIIEGNPEEAVVTLPTEEASNVTLAGFTIRGGLRGVYAEARSPASVRNCIVRDNVWQGVLAVSGSVIGNVVCCNGTQGMGVVSGIVSHNDVFGNGDCGITECFGLVSNNLVYLNEGNGIEYGNGLVNNTVCFNSGAGLENSSFGDGYNSPDEISNCIIWGNAQGSLSMCATLPMTSCIENPPAILPGMVTADPRFVDAVNGDFRLLPTSPCIDAGKLAAEVTEDFDGNSRPYDALDARLGGGSDYDMGAFEFIGEAVEPEGELEGEQEAPPAHWLAVEEDRDGDYLSDAEEEALGLNPDDRDENGNGTPDGPELAVYANDAIDALPWEGESTVTEGEWTVRGEVGDFECYWWCPIDGAAYDSMYTITNRRLDESFQAYGYEKHFLEHGSFTSFSLECQERARRIDPVEVYRILELKARIVLGLDVEGEPSEAEFPADGESPEAESPEGEIEGESKPGKFLNCGGTPGTPAASLLGDALVLCLAALWMSTYRRREVAK